MKYVRSRKELVSFDVLGYGTSLMQAQNSTHEADSFSLPHPGTCANYVKAGVDTNA